MNQDPPTQATSASTTAAAGVADHPEEKARYEAAWQTLDRHSKRFWIGIILFPPVVLLVTAILGRFIYGLLAFAIAVGLYFALRWALKLDRGPSLHDFACPRCGNDFFRKEKKTDTLSRKCLNCGLDRGALPPDFAPPAKPARK